MHVVLQNGIEPGWACQSATTASRSLSVGWALKFHTVGYPQETISELTFSVWFFVSPLLPVDFEIVSKSSYKCALASQYMIIPIKMALFLLY